MDVELPKCPETIAFVAKDKEVVSAVEKYFVDELWVKGKQSASIKIGELTPIDGNRNLLVKKKDIDKIQLDMGHLGIRCGLVREREPKGPFASVGLYLYAIHGDSTISNAIPF